MKPYFAVNYVLFLRKAKNLSDLSVAVCVQVLQNFALWKLYEQSYGDNVLGRHYCVWFVVFSSVYFKVCLYVLCPTSFSIDAPHTPPLCSSWVYSLLTKNDGFYLPSAFAIHLFFSFLCPHVGFLACAGAVWGKAGGLDSGWAGMRLSRYHNLA